MNFNHTDGEIEGGLNSTIEITIDGGGSAIETGVKHILQLPFAGTITSVMLLADQAGDIVIDIWKDTYANYDPPTHPAVGDTITAAAKPTLSAASKSTDSTLTGWTKVFAAGDILFFNVDSVATIELLTLVLNITR